MSLSLNNHLELGPNCPDHVKCPRCPSNNDCAYYYKPVTKWQLESRRMFMALKDESLSSESRSYIAVELARYLINHRGYYRLADTLTFIAENTQ